MIEYFIFNLVDIALDIARTIYAQSNSPEAGSIHCGARPGRGSGWLIICLTDPSVRARYVSLPVSFLAPAYKSLLNYSCGKTEKRTIALTIQALARMMSFRMTLAQKHSAYCSGFGNIRLKSNNEGSEHGEVIDSFTDCMTG